MAKQVYVTRIIPQPGIDLLRQHAKVDVNESDKPLSQQELQAKVEQYDALVTLLTDDVSKQVLDVPTHLKIVANVAVGYNNIDVPAATAKDIMVTNTPGVLTDTTADFAWALLMSVARRVCEAQAFLRAGEYKGWGILMMLGEDVHDKTLGIVGFGRIGQAVAKRARGFNMDILYYDPMVNAEDVAPALGARKTDLNTLLSQSDYVSVHTLLTEETHHLIGKPQFEAMKSDSYLINTSRGPVVDEPALAAAIRNHEIKGAALDVFENEPQVYADLLELPNVLLTPHIASASVATRTKMATMAAQNVIDAFEGKRPPNLINEETFNG
ncbi:MAG: 2-hydroxyacid dehydrogenase [Chloroflexota bacterium]